MSESGLKRACASAIGNDFLKGPTENLRIEITIGEQSEACASIICYRSQRLVYFMGYGRCQFPHGCQPGNMRKLHLCPMQRLFGLTPSVVESFPVYDLSGMPSIEVSEPQVTRRWTVRPSKVR